MDSPTYNSSIEEKEEEMEMEKELKAELRTTEYPQCGKLGGAAVLQVRKLELLPQTFDILAKIIYGK